MAQSPESALPDLEISKPQCFAFGWDHWGFFVVKVLRLSGDASTWNNRVLRQRAAKGKLSKRAAVQLNEIGNAAHFAWWGRA